MTDIEEVIPLVNENVNFNVNKILSENNSDNIKLSKDNISVKALAWYHIIKCLFSFVIYLYKKSIIININWFYLIL